MTRLSHALTADGSVLLTIVETGRAPRTFTVSAAMARRAAWAMLADIDPEEAMLAADEELRQSPQSWDHRRPVDRNRTREVRPAHRVQGMRPGSISNGILCALKAGPSTSRLLADVVKRPATNVSAMCAGLVSAGLVVRQLSGPRGVATWSLTALGEQRAAA